MYHSNESGDYVWMQVVRAKQKNTKPKTPQYNVHPHFANDRNNDMKFYKISN